MISLSEGSRSSNTLPVAFKEVIMLHCKWSDLWFKAFDLNYDYQLLN